MYLQIRFVIHNITVTSPLHHPQQITHTQRETYKICLLDIFKCFVCCNKKPNPAKNMITSNTPITGIRFSILDVTLH